MIRSYLAPMRMMITYLMLAILLTCGFAGGSLASVGQHPSHMTAMDMPGMQHQAPADKDQPCAAHGTLQCLCAPCAATLLPNALRIVEPAVDAAMLTASPVLPLADRVIVPLSPPPRG